MTAGAASGTPMAARMRRSRQPSMRAESTMAPGMVRKKAASRYTEKGRVSPV